MGGVVIGILIVVIILAGVIYSVIAARTLTIPFAGDGLQQVSR